MGDKDSAGENYQHASTFYLPYESNYQHFQIDRNSSDNAAALIEHIIEYFPVDLV